MLGSSHMVLHLQMVYSGSCPPISSLLIKPTSITRVLADLSLVTYYTCLSTELSMIMFFPGSRFGHFLQLAEFTAAAIASILEH